ncbi:MAG: AMP-binding protein [Simkaniaceae bacterium]|nr:AMP-binding protein [Simkaniaceae bacterium]
MKSVECPFSYHGRENPKLIALEGAGEKYTYEECDAKIRSVLLRVRERGIKSGDRVGIIPPHTLHTPVVLFALFRLGVAVCLIGEHIPEGVVSSLSDRTRAHSLIGPDVIRELLSGTGKGRSCGTTPPCLDLKVRATYLPTSGTTAKAKIACHTLGNHYYSALGSNMRFGLLPTDRYLHSLPFHHISGIAPLFRVALAGATLVFGEGRQPRCETLLEQSITHLSAVPTQLYRLLKEGVPSDMVALSARLKGILLGGAPIASSLYERAGKVGLPLYPSYGMTEMSSQIATSFGAESADFSLGHLLPYREWKIDERGEIFVRGKTLFAGYADETDEPDLPLDEEGYFPTGDIGVYHGTRGLILRGRKDRLFISGGENIYPEEIETVLGQMEGILTARVVPEADREFGMRPVAYIRSIRPVREGSLTEYLAPLLPKWKIPIRFVTERGGC